MRRFIVVVALVTFAALFRADDTYACSCPAERSPTEALRGATAVFEGTVLDQRAVLADACGVLNAAIEYDIAVTRVWKGTIPRTVHVLRRCLCDPSFRVGQPYLLYTSGDHCGRLLAAACTPTKPADQAAQDVAELGRPVVTFVQAPVDVPESMPLRRRARASIVVGLGVYLSLFREWRDALRSFEAAWLAAVVLQLSVGAVYVMRHRLRRGSVALGGGVITALCAVAWSGERLLANEWLSAFLLWR